MKTCISLLLNLFTLAFAIGRQTDTLTFYSQALNQNRTIYVQTPEFYAYQSEAVQLPVVYILDGQHEWFVNPITTTLRYLQYTHEIPQCIVVIIPLADRNTECLIPQFSGAPSPLASCIRNEIDQQIKKYNPNPYKIIIGHSFTASFALYAYLKDPEYYSAVIAHSPLYAFEELIQAITQNRKTDPGNLYLSIGGIDSDKDLHHRKNYNQLKEKYPSFFKNAQIFEADYSAHNAVPIIATPYFLTKIFSKFSSRYTHIAAVDLEYKLIHMPVSIEDERLKITHASQLGPYAYPPEIPEINGLASRYLADTLWDYGIAMYELGILYYPKNYEFHLALYELYLPKDKRKAKLYLKTAYALLMEYEKDMPDQKEMLEAIQAEMIKNEE
jgi:predicted alpha/beta superfamily hydrolase